MPLCTKRPWGIVCNNGKIDYNLRVLINKVLYTSFDYKAAVKIHEVKNEKDHMKCELAFQRLIFNIEKRNGE